MIPPWLRSTVVWVAAAAAVTAAFLTAVAMFLALDPGPPALGDEATVRVANEPPPNLSSHNPPICPPTRR